MSVLADASNRKELEEQLAPVTGRHDWLPDANCVAAKPATGGLFVMVSVTFVPTIIFGMTRALESANFTSVMLKDAELAGLLTISKATDARRLPFTVVDKLGKILTAG